MQKDYWNISKRNFRAMAIVSIIFVIIAALGGLDSSNAVSMQNTLLSLMLLFLTTTVLFFIIASLFKRRSPKAIKVAYGYLAIIIVFALFSSFIPGLPATTLVSKLISLIIPVYLLVNVYKASKQAVQ